MDSLIRRFLLKEICGKLDIIEDLRENHFIMLEPREKDSDEYIATCPFCQAPKALAVNKTTGRSFCSACELTEDYFSLKGGYRMSKVEDVLVELCIRLERLANPESRRRGGAL